MPVTDSDWYWSGYIRRFCGTWSLPECIRSHLVGSFGWQDHSWNLFRIGLLHILESGLSGGIFI